MVSRTDGIERALKAADGGDLAAVRDALAALDAADRQTRWGRFLAALAAGTVDAGLRRRVIPAARERVLHDFDNRALVGRLAEIYQEALTGSQGS